MNTLTDICAALADLPAVATIHTAIADTITPLRVAPLIAAARAPVVAALACQRTAPLLYVVANGDAALRAAEDLRQWLVPEHVLLYPVSDTMPYEHISPGIELVSQRLRVLQRIGQLRNDNTPCVVVTSVRALMQTTLPPTELAHANQTLQRDDEISQDALLRRWTDFGYRAAPSVEEPGEFNRRGGIVDVWPVADEQPLRIEWFGDEIDSLRRFDPGTQRSEQRVDQAVIGPAQEIPLWRRAEAVQWMHTINTAALRTEGQEEWQAAIERLEQGELFDGISFYAPFFRAANTQQASLLAHLAPGTAVLLGEALLLAQTAADYHEQSETHRNDLVEANELAPDFPRPYMLWDELWANTTATIVDLSNNDFEPGNREQGTGEKGQGTDDNEPQNRIPSLRKGTRHAVSAPAFINADLFGGQFKRLVRDILKRLRAGEQVIAVTTQAARLQELVAEAAQRDDEDEGESTEPPAYPQLVEEESTKYGAQSAKPPAYPQIVEGHGQAAKEPAARDTQSPIADLAFTPIYGTLDAGWRSPDLNLTLYTDTEIFGLRQRRPLSERRRQKARSTNERTAFLRGLKPGDYVVHIEHGIAVYEGLIRRTVGEIEREYLSLRYAANDRIYVPVDQVDRVARYIGAGDSAPQLTRLGTQEWERAKRKARAAVQDLADELLKLYAQRQIKQGYAFGEDGEWQRELETAFPYVETPDQLQTLDEVKHDMEDPHPMDRLICGDVGFGKTEIALRAAFKAVQDGKQVAVLVPTTVLAQQHFDTFSRRMSAFPVTVEMLSRFRTTKEQNAILQQLVRGKVDIVIGTHRLLSKDVLFKDLGLLIVDEEQRFGVRHKERLKQMRAEVDVLTLTATPIPRTLHMALAGIRDLSVINTPPEDRVPIKTYVAPYGESLVRDAIEREIDRDGQVYFVHNRVQSIYHVANRLRYLVPEARIAVGHGQLDERELERVILDFFNGDYDVLVCTTIIENGLDVSNANTLIIDDATNYGLAQLYQLRGRVGRSTNRAYAYLLYKPDRRMTEEAQQRLEAIQEATELGAGFRVAMRDLEIRGAGNLLGAEQSGHIAAVGFDLYSRLLEQAVQQLKERFDAATGDETDATNGVGAKAPVINEKVLVSPLVTLDLPLTAYLPEEYIPDDRVRIDMYQRMVEAQTPEEVYALRQELRDRFGEPPAPAMQLLTWLQIKALALNAGVTSVITTNEEFIVRLPIIDNAMRERLRRRYGRDTSVKVGPQFIRLNRRSLNGEWVEKLTGVLVGLAA